MLIVKHIAESVGLKVELPMKLKMDISGMVDTPTVGVWKSTCTMLKPSKSSFAR